MNYTVQTKCINENTCYNEMMSVVLERQMYLTVTSNVHLEHVFM